MRRLSSLQCFLAGGLSLALGVTIATTTSFISTPHARADDNGSGLSTYNLHAAAGGIQYFASSLANEGAGTIDGGIPYSVADLRYGPSGHALSSIMWPGSIGGNLGSLLLVSGLPTSLVTGQLPIPLPPPPNIPTQLDPVLPYFNDPVRAEAATGGQPDVQNNSIPGTAMSARVENTLVKASSQLASTTNLLTGSQNSTSAVAQVELTGPTTATATAESFVSDITLPGGLVKIGSVKSVAVATSDGVKATVTGGTTVADITVAGVHVSVDDKGLTIAGNSVPLTTVTDLVNSTLSKAGISMFVGKPVRTVKGASVVYDAGSLVVDLPQGIILEIGGSQVSVNAAVAGSYGGGGGIVPPPTVTGVDPGSGGSSVPPTATDPGTTGSLPDTGTPGTGTGPGPLVVQPAGAITGLPGGLGWGWVAFVIAGAGLVALGLRRLPERVLVGGAAACSLTSSANDPLVLGDVDLGDEL